MSSQKNSKLLLETIQQKSFVLFAKIIHNYYLFILIYSLLKYYYVVILQERPEESAALPTGFDFLSDW